MSELNTASTPVSRASRVTGRMLSNRVSHRLAAARDALESIESAFREVGIPASAPPRAHLQAALDALKAMRDALPS